MPSERRLCSDLPLPAPCFRPAAASSANPTLINSAPVVAAHGTGFATIPWVIRLPVKNVSQYIVHVIVLVLLAAAVRQPSVLPRVIPAKKVIAGLHSYWISAELKITVVTISCSEV